MQHTDTGLSPVLPPARPDKRGQAFISRDSKSSEEGGDSSSSIHPGQSATTLFMNPAIGKHNYTVQVTLVLQ